MFADAETTQCIELSHGYECAVVAEARDRGSLAEVANKYGCEIYKEQGEEFYRVICLTNKQR